MQDLFDAAKRLEVQCKASGLRFCFIGGVAVQRWGKPRVTRDLDLSIWTGFGSERSVITQLLGIAPGRVPDAEGFALTNRVLLLKNAEGIDIDAALAALPFEDAMITRATPFDFLPGVTLTTCSAEDLLVLKAFADRPRDWGDIEGIILRQRSIDWPYVDECLAPLVELKEAPEIMTRLIELRTKLH